MDLEKGKICRPNNPDDGPRDGVQMEVECIRTDFLNKQQKRGKVFTQRKKSPAHISASMELGVFSVRDMKSGVMLTVTLQDAMEVIAAAVDVAKEEKHG